VDTGNTNQQREIAMSNVKWNWESVQAEAKKYATVTGFKAGSRGAYAWAERNNMVKEATAFMAPLGSRRMYTREYVAFLSQPFNYFSDFVAAHPVAVSKASEHGFYDVLDHLERSANRGVRDGDAVYCWVVTGAANDDVLSPLPGYNLCKVGVTSARLGDQRPTLCSAKNGMGMELVGVMRTPAGRATDYEKLMLSLGSDAGVPSHYDGYTEFRIFSDAELGDMRQLLCA
jgi:hypothetical protein